MFGLLKWGKDGIIMNKEYSGLEIMNMIAEGKIKKGEKFEVKLLQPEVNLLLDKIFVFDGEDFMREDYNENCTWQRLTDILTLKELPYMSAKRISDKIDIQAIEELNKQDSETMNEETITEKINEVIKAVKYLDKKEG